MQASWLRSTETYVYQMNHSNRHEHAGGEDLDRISMIEILTMVGGVGAWSR